MENWSAPNYPLSIVEIGTWRTIYNGDFEVRALSVGFFSDGRALFLNFAPGKGQGTELQALLDIQSGKRTEGIRPSDPSRFFEEILPIDDRNLLIAHYSKQKLLPMRLQWLARVEFPSYRELVRIETPQKGIDSDGVMLSADRKLMIYVSGKMIVFRSTWDLSVVWQHPIEEGLAISAQGDYIALRVARDPDGQVTRNPYISIYDRRTKGEIARIRIPETDIRALSPDGKLLATVVPENGTKGEVSPTVHLYDVSSGIRVASVVHDSIPLVRRQALLSGCNVQFTADGKYMITAGMVTRVWRVADCCS